VLGAGLKKSAALLDGRRPLPNGVSGSLVNEANEARLPNMARALALNRGADTRRPCAAAAFREGRAQVRPGRAGGRHARTPALRADAQRR
jgi:hypothetical protein